MAFRKRVLFVAPKTDLYYAPKEAEVVVNLLGANLLNGIVNTSDLISRVRQYQPHLVIVSSHGTKGGILLSDGIIGADLLKPIFSTTPVECVYLNTCESYDTANAIYNELPTSFIATIMPIPDKTAYVSMTAFAHHLANGLAYDEAWYRSKTAGNKNTVFWPAIAKIGAGQQMTPVDAVTQPAKRNGDGEIEDLNEEVSKLSYAVFGNEHFKLIGLMTKMVKIQDRVNQLLVLQLMVVLLGLLILAAAVGWRFS